LGEGFQETGNIPKAIEEYQRAIEIEPNNYTLTYNMGYCLYESGNYK
jgi:Tfp pilus assembly protein PilF